MKRLALVLIFAIACASFAAPARAADDGFKPLFNGQNLDGWTGDPEIWKVVDGEIVGNTDNTTLKHNSFLITTRPYKNFVLKAKFKLRNHNSGIQFRSQQFDEFVVKGYQADMADTKYLGVLHEEGGRPTLADVDQAELAKFAKPNEWNEYTITADGPHITLALNGHQTVDYTETDATKGATEGVIALQLHQGPKMQVEFKDIRIKELP